MFKLAELVVDITGNSRPLMGTLSAVRGALGALASGGGGALGGLARGIGGLGSSLAHVGVAAGVIGGGALAVGLVKSVEAASDLNEQLSKAGAVFGPEAKKITDAADEMAKKFGIPKAEFIDGANRLGQLGKAAGQTKGQAAELGATMAKLAADLSSFANISNEEALNALASGLAGESEPLRRHGVLLSEDAVKAEAYRMKLAKVGAELTDQQKVLARTALIQRGLADASGDLDRTSGGFANQSRKAWGQLTNLMAEFGNLIMPVANAAIQTLNKLIGDLGGIVERNKESITEWSEWVAEKVRYAGLAFTNWGDFVEIGRLLVQEKVLQIQQIFRNLADNLVAIAGWAGPAFGQMLMNVLALIPPVADALASFALGLPAVFGKVGGLLGEQLAAGFLAGLGPMASMFAAMVEDMMVTLRLLNKATGKDPGFDKRLADAKEELGKLSGKFLWESGLADLPKFLAGVTEGVKPPPELKSLLDNLPNLKEQLGPLYDKLKALVDATNPDVSKGGGDAKAKGAEAVADQATKKGKKLDLVDDFQQFARRLQAGVFADKDGTAKATLKAGQDTVTELKKANQRLNSMGRGLAVVGGPA